MNAANFIRLVHFIDYRHFMPSPNAHLHPARKCQGLRPQPAAGRSGGVNILSTQLMGDSYFLTGAFPAECGNAISGVMDMRLRKGNDEKQEFTVQAGLIGFDVAAEGPLSKKSKVSYERQPKPSVHLLTKPSDSSWCRGFSWD